MALNLEPVAVGGGANTKLLWTNPTPTAAFAPQSIQLGGEYDAFYISYFVSASNNEHRQTQLVIADAGATTQRITFANFYTNTGTRDVTVYKNLIAFGKSYSGSTGATNNSNIIPYQIYGVSFDGDAGADLTSVPPGYTLLWANPNPTEAFAAQDVSVASLSEYDMIQLLYTFDCTDGTLGNAVFASKSHPNSMFSYASQGWVATRKASADFQQGKISFANASANGTTVNEASVPVQIYGIKF